MAGFTLSPRHSKQANVRMIKSVFVIFLTTCFLQLVAQNNYQPGFVVENNGDTVKGSIDYKRWDRSPTKITFKSVTQSKVYAPLDIKVFYRLQMKFTLVPLSMLIGPPIKLPRRITHQTRFMKRILFFCNRLFKVKRVYFI